MSAVVNADAGPALIELAAAGMPDRDPDPASSSAARVLCVDDDPEILAQLARALGRRFHVVTRPDPLAALALVEHGEFAVVLADLWMPGMPGLTFLERVKSLAPACTRLGMTGCLELSLPPDIAFGLLTKPCPPPLLEATVAAAVQFHALHSTAAQVALPERWSAPPPVAESGLRPARAASGGAPPLAHAAARSIPAARGCRLALALLGTSIELWPRATLLGRARDNDIVIQDARIAPRHLRFFRSWRGVTVQDLSGTRAVRLNGARLTELRFIESGDRIDLGPFEARVQSLDAPGPLLGS